MSWGSFPGKETVTPVGAADRSNFLIVLRQSPIRTKPLYIVLLTTLIGGCNTLGKKLQKTLILEILVLDLINRCNDIERHNIYGHNIQNPKTVLYYNLELLLKKLNYLQKIKKDLKCSILTIF